MQVRSLQIQRLRNISAAQIEFSGRNLLIGLNGAGKTSVVEAMAVAVNGKSFRSADLRALVQRGADFWRTEAEVVLVDGSCHSIMMSGSLAGRERCVLDGQPVGVTRLAARFPAVAFVPEDRDLVVGQPNGRREYLDGILHRTNPQLQRTLTRATKLLKQRQTLIRSNKPDQVTLDFFDQELASASAVISEARESLLASIEQVVQSILSVVSSSSELIKFQYIRSWSKDPLQELINARPLDIARGSTSVGFHRDDVGIELNGLSARSSASQGQVRSIALALRVGSAFILMDEVKEPPVLLLDDVFSEFDRERASRIFQLVGQFQTFATNTEAISPTNQWSVMEVKGGEIVSRR